mmetsp:Transcript_38666/g.64236  ORF Transcript_38666/g.64236 Transcript_38666/m.64236 type:complete len:151 (-) Transcript_38666:754-1206(-)
MPQAKYYCDYCDRSFNDTPQARKKHLDSKFHSMQVKMHYDSYKDPFELIAEEAAMPICQNWIRSGRCDYGDRCKYAHRQPPPPGVFIMPPAKKEESLPSSWTPVQQSTSDTQTSSSQLPIFPCPVEALPPSLRPPPTGGWVIRGAIPDWG